MTAAVLPAGTAARFTPPMPPLADDRAGGLRVLLGLRRNGFSAFPARCLRKGVVRLWVPGRSLVLASSPDAVKAVLQDGAADFRRLRAGRRIIGPIVGRGLLTSEGEAWRRQRRAMAPAFTPRTVPVLAGHIARCAEAACSGLEAAAAGARVDRPGFGRAGQDGRLLDQRVGAGAAPGA